MAELPSPSDIATLASLIAPGLIILGVRSRFRDSTGAQLKDQIVAYAVASSAYYAATYPLFHVQGGLEIPIWLWRLLQYFIVPVLVALAVVAFDQSEIFYKAPSKFGLRLAHHIPSAWDFAFSKLVKGTFVLVKLNDGTQYAGVMGKESFASSSTVERDLYIQEVWSVPKNGSWKVVEPRRGVLLCGKDIRWVEIFRR